MKRGSGVRSILPTEIWLSFSLKDGTRHPGERLLKFLTASFDHTRTPLLHRSALWNTKSLMPLHLLAILSDVEPSDLAIDA